MISKAEALAKMTAQDEADHARLTARIDESLAHYHGQPVTVSAEGVSGKVLDQLTREYRERGGWDVSQYSGDQRDPGPYLTFK